MSRVAIVITENDRQGLGNVLPAFLALAGIDQFVMQPMEGKFESAIYVCRISTPRLAEKVDRVIFEKAVDLLPPGRMPFVLAFHYAAQADFSLGSSPVEKPWLKWAGAGIVLHRDTLFMDDPQQHTQRTAGVLRAYLAAGAAYRQDSAPREVRAPAPVASFSLSVPASSPSRRHNRERAELEATLGEIARLVDRARALLQVVS